MNRSTIAIIPARMGSSRFPGKPLENICGIPMIGHVYKRVKMSKHLDYVFVATCDKEIFDYIESIGGNAVMTSDSHERCTDRTAEAVEIIELEKNIEFEIVLMVQGDEPMVTPTMIESSIEAMLEDNKVNVVNLIAKINSKEEFEDPNEVKVVKDLKENALYFSREPIPSMKKFDHATDWFKQVCIIPFRRDYLFKFNELLPTPLEEVESVDMMRILEHGESVKCVEITEKNFSVDTREDLEKVEELMSVDPLIECYK
ncbi:MAG: 3-deoxy-manno-octulosonate cytidylyltransferase [Flavobacteriales bacterium]|nr:3-deoxy-manno-octulosonate cytidylyltransferase [Flavobacteriales bacterium]